MRIMLAVKDFGITILWILSRRNLEYHHLLVIVLPLKESGQYPETSTTIQNTGSELHFPPKLLGMFCIFRPISAYCIVDISIFKIQWYFMNVSANSRVDIVMAIEMTKALFCFAFQLIYPLRKIIFRHKKVACWRRAQHQLYSE